MIDRRAFLAGGAAMLATPAVAQGRSLDAAVAELPQLHSLQVRLGDEIAYAAAPRGPGLSRAANIKSVSKSIVALLLGAAIARGEIAGVDVPLAEVAPTLLRGATDGAGAITLEDLVTLRAGLERTSGANYGGWVSSQNWVRDALSRPFVAEPGGPLLYSTGSTHILGAALAEATGRSLLAQARERIGAPLGIDIPPWTRAPEGYYLGGNEMALRPTAMLEIATMLRDGGRHGGAEVIAESWIDASLEPRTRSRWSGLGYGYGWFLSRSGWALGRGYGGQIIAADRRAGLAVALTSDPTRPARSGGYFSDIMALLEGPVRALA
ncbi:MAG: serine hydrolase [Pseudomonadota bacterium]